jgi:hypothetical protein
MRNEALRLVLAAWRPSQEPAQFDQSSHFPQVERNTA